ncbi:hypothetical protein J7E49_17230 [Variovorax paradoxus]|nr:hypothetical protein [Variovorax paradoxus]
MNNAAFGFLLATVVVALLLAALVIAGCLVAAAMYPRGHPAADRLRAFAGRLPCLAARGVVFLDRLIFVIVLALFAVLTIVFS